jgi:hypothetical protein
MRQYSVFEPLAEKMAAARAKKLVINGHIGRSCEYDTVIRRAKEIAKQISPSIYEKLVLLDTDGKIKVNENYNIDLELTGIKMLSVDELADKDRIAELQRVISGRQNRAADTHYSLLRDTLYLNTAATDDDILAVLHETAHGVTKGAGKFLREIVPITAELTAERFIKSSIRAERINEMKTYAKAVNELFAGPSGVGGNGGGGGFWDNAVGGGNGGEMLASYFFGTASALALEPKIKTPGSLEKIINIINEKKLTDSEKLSALGLTAERIMRAYYDSAVSCVLTEMPQP